MGEVGGNWKKGKGFLLGKVGEVIGTEPMPSLVGVIPSVAAVS